MFDFLLENDTLSAIVAFILVLIPAVIIHEIGHFTAAKLVGITILEFGIGLPPRAIKLFTLRGTDYTLNWIPLGGFVRPLGEDMVRQKGDDALNEDRQEAHARGIQKIMSVNEAPPRSRVFFLMAGALANFVLAFILFVVIALTGIPEIIGGRTNVLYLEPSAALAAAGVQNLDAIEAVNGENIDSSQDLLTQLYALSGETVTLRVRRADQIEALNIEVTLPAVTGTPTSDTHPMIVGVVDDTPAATSGLLPLDIVTAFDGTPVFTNEELRDLTQTRRGEAVMLTVWREGQIVEIPIVPRLTYPSDQGSMGIQLSGALSSIDPALGLAFQDGAPQQQIVPLGFGESLQYAWERFTGVIQIIASVPGQILDGTARGEDLRPASIIGISQIGGFYLQESIQRDRPTIIIEYIALISVVLGLTNLLPIPALDGGRILFVIIEVLRGRPIAPEREGMVHLVGMALLLSLMVVVMFNDIVNPLTDILR
ncbi:MAG: RIP metalloprotease RseP [Chloroflexota bacterium]|nr:RIP metalloprotease RseP [Chloroflexota bacterium]